MMNRRPGPGVAFLCSFLAVLARPLGARRHHHHPKHPNPESTRPHSPISTPAPTKNLPQLLPPRSPGSPSTESAGRAEPPPTFPNPPGSPGKDPQPATDRSESCEGIFCLEIFSFLFLGHRFPPHSGYQNSIHVSAVGGARCICPSPSRSTRGSYFMGVGLIPDGCCVGEIGRASCRERVSR